MTKATKSASIVLLVVLMTLTCFLCTPPVQAQPVITTFTATETASAVGGDMGMPKRTIESNGLMHILCMPITFHVTGDVVGDLVVTHSFRVDLTTGGGFGFGSQNFEGTFSSLTVGFDGRYILTFYPIGPNVNSVSGWFIANGNDDWSKMKIGGSFSGTVTDPGTSVEEVSLTLSGIIFDPRG